MRKIPESLPRQREAREQLAKISENCNNVLVIHYSCESFYNHLSGRTPRIASIAVRNLATAQTESFSIHLVVERYKELTSKDINEHYEEFEKKILEEFYNYVKNHRNHTWLHWNMRSANYGFAALEHRYSVLGGDPFEIQESRRCDLAQLLDRLYGTDYIDPPHLENLIKKNSITNLDFLSGKDEAKAFENGQYAEMHLSNIRKVAVISDIADRAADNTLITKVQLTKGSGGSSGRGIKGWFRRLHIMGSIASITSWIQGC